MTSTRFQLCFGVGCITTLLLTALMGCQRSQLRVRVDVYGDDPTLEVQGSPQRIERVVDESRTLVNTTFDRRTRLSESAAAAIADAEHYLDYASRLDSVRLGPNPTADASSQSRPSEFELLLDYATSLNDSDIEARTAIEKRQHELDVALEKLTRSHSVLELARDTNRLANPGDHEAHQLAIVEVFLRFAALEAACQSYIRPAEVGMLYIEQALTAGKEQLASSVEQFAESSTKDDRSDRINLLRSIASEMRTSESRAKQDGFYGWANQAGRDAEVLESVADLLSNVKDVDGTPTAISVSDTELNVIRSTGPFPGAANVFGPTQRRSGLADQAVSMDLYSSQIDRLQDPADPVWRVITAPENRRKWNRVINKVYYRAEGNSQVILVQDRIGHFRPVNVKNDPTALIESQARINRSIASGAVSILGALAGSAGVPAAGNIANAVSDKVSPGADSPGMTDEASSLLAGEAPGRLSSDAAAARLQRERAALTLQLTKLRTQLATTDPNSDTLSKKEQDTVTAIVRAYQRIFDDGR